MIKVGNAPCSWGVLEFELEGETAGYEQFLKELKDTGYEGTELGDWGYMPTDPAKLREELTSREIDLVGAFVPVALCDENAHAEGIEVGIKTAKLMADAGFKDAFIVLADNNGSVPARTKAAGRVTPDLLLPEEGWKNVRAGVESFARQVRDKTGLRTVFHHHCAGYVETPGEIERLLMDTPADALGLVLDMGHYRFGGGYPEAAIKLFWDRIQHIHYKDCSAAVAAASREKGWDYFESVQNGVFCELGKGVVDFEAITQEIRRRNYEGWIVVEQDVLPGMGSPVDCARRNREYLKSLGL
ncbi:2-keto-myo-inositol dehydratase [Alkalispirochaeta americana]|uniref:2-keto-myo-inositol dehydratase n=1 Tax=Alkalispirochaeta americana TaxID=159291 RepID=A0A1N6RA00_9SPIO|nr:sugar phosphate isomerase/epimerase [Alkalispirochaeta americana]SIQ25502.1 2-keto-myo-inositol dehydratase [Alkalispirochaeta americana]